MFSSLRDASFSIPILDIDLASIKKAMDDLLNLLEVDIWSLGPEVLLNNAQGFLTLNVLVSLLKPVLSASTAILALANVVSPNVPTSKLAGDSDFDEADVKKHIQRYRSESAAGGTVTNPVSSGNPTTV